MTEDLRVLVVGYGLIGRKRAQALAELAVRRPVRLAGTVDPSHPGSGGVAPHWDDLAEVPTDAYDAAVIAVPHHLAGSVAFAVLGAGRPVLVEKPLGLSLAEGEEIARASRTAGRPSFVGYNYRFLPVARRALIAAARGDLGNLRSADLLLGHGGHPGSAESWKLSPEFAGGGVLLDPGVHLIDLARCLAPNLTPAFATATRGFWGTGVEEDAVAVLTVGDLIVTIRVSHVRWVNTFRFEVVGTDGYAVASGRGSTYGPQSLRLGRRWAWNDGSGRYQRDTEDVLNLGDDDRSLRDELAAVLDRWLGEPVAFDDAGPGPATMDEALAVAEIWERLVDMAGIAALSAPGPPPPRG